MKNLKQALEGIFSLAADAFERIPLLNRFKGYRTIIGLAGLASVWGLQKEGLVTDPDIIRWLNGVFAAWTALALNAKGRTAE